LVLVFDLDGVIYLGSTAIPGAIAGLNALRHSGHSLFFLTNNSTRKREHYADLLTSLGAPSTPSQIITSAYAAGLYLAGAGAAGKRVYVVGEHGLRDELNRVGMAVAEDADLDPVDYVVAGLNRKLTYDHLARAHLEIGRGAQFIATNRDRTYPTETGEIPGGGAIVAPIEASTGVTGITIGKPEPLCWRIILREAGCRADEAMMIGDRPETDIQGARAVGLGTTLVLSGVTSASDLPGLPPEQQPDHVLAGVSELPDLLEKLSMRAVPA